LKKIIFLLLISIGNIIAQEKICGSQLKLKKFLHSNPEFLKIRDSLEINSINFESIKHTNITVPVVVHVVFSNQIENISYNQIISQIDVLNKDFTRTNIDANNTPLSFLPMVSDMQINFCLAQQTPNGMPTNGIVRKQTNLQSFPLYGDEIHYDTSGGSTAWDTKKYLNIWVCNIDTGILGWAQFPAGGNPETDGVVIDYEKFGTNGTVSPPYDLGRTTTHEVGHWLNLWHIWGDNNCGDDFVNDTPEQEEANYGCKIHPHPSCNNSGDMFMNFMDYTNDGCMNSFTLGQKNRVWSAIINYRYELLNSQACNTPISLNSDAGIVSILEPNNTNLVCADAIYAKVILKNYGNDTLSSATIKYNINSNNENTYNWNGNLIPGNTDTIILPVISSIGNNHILTVRTTLANGSLDINPSNNQKSKIFSSFNGKSVNIKIRTDNYGNENSWTLTNIDNNYIVDSMNVLSNNTTYNLDFCLDYGCYMFVINDSFGDGFCCNYGNGYYEISEKISNNYYANVNQFLFTDTTYFCIGSTEINNRLENLQIYPNPSRGKLYLNHENYPNNRIILAKVFNTLGQLVFSKEINNKTINLNKLKDGIYYLKLNFDNNITTKKIILNKSK
tara:strand:- start:52793 stop:54643 length:1851 start_codon:yes stop_codon:yes gene_type:complete